MVPPTGWLGRSMMLVLLGSVAIAGGIIIAGSSGERSLPLAAAQGCTGPALPESGAEAVVYGTVIAPNKPTDPTTGADNPYYAEQLTVRVEASSGSRQPGPGSDLFVYVLGRSLEPLAVGTCVRVTGRSSPFACGPACDAGGFVATTIESPFDVSYVAQ